MKNYLFLTLLFFSINLNNFAQNAALPTFKLLNYVENTIIASNYYEDEVYLIKEGKSELIISSPGAGRFIDFDWQNLRFSFKEIDIENNLQRPAIYLLNQIRIIYLDNYATRVGQPSFSKNDDVAYFYENSLIVKNLKNGGEKKIAFNFFSNRAPISPDGNYVVVKNDNDELILFNLSSGQRKKISPENKSCFNAIWSSDGRYIAFVSNRMEIFVYDLNKNEVKLFDYGEIFEWNRKNNELLYERKIFDANQMSFVEKSLNIYKADKETIRKIKNIRDDEIISAVFSSIDDEIIISTSLDQLSFSIINLTTNKTKKIIIEKSDATMSKESRVFKLKNIQSEINLSRNIDWVHVHQVYQTRQDWNQGRSCCGAATAAEILATYGIYQPKPIYTYNAWSNYGFYISDRYVYNNITYDNFDGVWPSGGHGYMWRSGYSPYSSIVSFLKNHKIDYALRLDNPSFSDVKNELMNGNCYVICSTGLTSGHIVLVVGWYGNYQTLVCNDPYGDKNLGNYGYTLNGKYAIYDWGDENTGRQKITPAVWGVRVRHQPKEAPIIWRTSPAKSGDTIYNIQTISYEFSRQMDTNTIKNSLKIYPNVEGKLRFSDFGRKVEFVPLTKFQPNENYFVEIDTSACDVFGAKLETKYLFNFSTYPRDKLSVTKIYPYNGSNKVPIRNQFIIQFDGLTHTGALTGKVFLYDKNNNKVTLANLKHEANKIGSKFTFEPKNPLSYNDYYTLVLSSSVTDKIGYSLEKDIIISFSTEDVRIEGGIVVCDFENAAGWQISTDSSLTYNFNFVSSTLSASSSRKLFGSSSLMFSYSFNDESNGKVCIFRDPSFNIGHSNRFFGIWIFGDYSENRVKYLLNNNYVNQNKILDIYELDWAGWKFVHVDLSEHNLGDDVSFKGIIIEKNESSNKDGMLYFDDATIDFVTDAKFESNILLNDKKFELYQNFPNPFNSSTVIKFYFAEECEASVKVYNILGSLVKIIFKGRASSGINMVRLDSDEISTGVYYLILKSKYGERAIKIICIK